MSKLPANGDSLNHVKTPGNDEDAARREPPGRSELTKARLTLRIGVGCLVIASLSSSAASAVMRRERSPGRIAAVIFRSEAVSFRGAHAGFDRPSKRRLGRVVTLDDLAPRGRRSIQLLLARGDW